MGKVFDSAYSFKNDGFAVVAEKNTDGERSYGLIDSEGNYIIKPFSGKEPYHIG